MNKIHHLLSRSKWVVRFLILVRNQCYVVINYYLTPSPNGDKNGEDLLVNHIAPFCNTMIDVGANKGNYSAYFLSKQPNVKAFLVEPSSEAFGLLSKKFSNTANVQLINIAISNVITTMMFYQEAGAGETSSLLQSFSLDSSTARAIDVKTIDWIAEQYQLSHIEFIKIDCEGYDYFAISGADRLLKEKKIDILQFEYNKPWAYSGATLYHTMLYFTERGYCTFLLQNDGLHEFDYQKYGEFFGYSNFVAVNADKISLIKTLIKQKI